MTAPELPGDVRVTCTQCGDVFAGMDDGLAHRCGPSRVLVALVGLVVLSGLLVMAVSLW